MTKKSFTYCLTFKPFHQGIAFVLLTYDHAHVFWNPCPLNTDTGLSEKSYFTDYLKKAPVFTDQL